MIEEKKSFFLLYSCSLYAVLLYDRACFNHSTFVGSSQKKAVFIWLVIIGELVEQQPTINYMFI